MKSFLLVVGFTIIAFVIFDVDAKRRRKKAGVDVDTHYTEVFASRAACHAGYTGRTSLTIDEARNKCKNTGITNEDCYKACIYEKGGCFNSEGEYQEARWKEVIDGMFTDGAANPYAGIWHNSTKACIMKHKQEFEGKYPQDYTVAECHQLDKFEDCLAAARDCDQRPKPKGP